MVVVWKELDVYQGQKKLFDDARCFFYITNDWEKPAEEIVFDANGRCNQENLLAQLKGGVRSLTAPVDNLLSNWAYMVMGSLAWSLKAWAALVLPETGRWQERHREEKRKLLRMDFSTFRARDDERSGADPLGRDGRSSIGCWHGIPGSTSSSVCWISFAGRCVAESSNLEAGVRMLRSAFTPNRTECNRVRHEARSNPTPHPDVRWRRPLTVSSDISTKTTMPERLRRSLV